MAHVCACAGMPIPTVVWHLLIRDRVNFQSLPLLVKLAKKYKIKLKKVVDAKNKKLPFII